MEQFHGTEHLERAGLATRTRGEPSPETKKLRQFGKIRPLCFPTLRQADNL